MARRQVRSSACRHQPPRRVRRRDKRTSTAEPPCDHLIQEWPEGLMMIPVILLVHEPLMLTVGCAGQRDGGDRLIYGLPPGHTFVGYEPGHYCVKEFAGGCRSHTGPCHICRGRVQDRTMAAWGVTAE